MNNPSKPEVDEAPASPHSLAAPLSLSLVVITILVASACWVWRQLPADARIPTHWNAAGKVDGYGGRNSLFFLPAVILGISIMFLFIPRIDPRRTNLLRSYQAYSAIWLSSVLFLAGLHIFVLRAALGSTGDLRQYLLIGAGFCLIVMGNYLGKVRSNFFVGVRTPWTLSSELSWNKTHRLTGWALVLFGFALAAAGTLQASSTQVRYLIYCFVPVLLWTTIAYSYLVWRHDNTKRVSNGPDSEAE